jgi:hypothetical protein
MIIDIEQQHYGGDTPKPGLSVENDVEPVKSFDVMGSGTPSFGRKADGPAMPPDDLKGSPDSMVFYWRSTGRCRNTRRTGGRVQRVPSINSRDQPVA